MLSTENPPPDPSCPPQQLTSNSDERASQKLALPEVVVVAPPDLSKDHTPLPKFSIRDYVFTARSKDIKKNWPFSLKNLQLCLKHGVKDVLPPLGSTETARNQSLVRCMVETENCSSKTDARNTCDGAGVNRKLVDPCTYGGDNDFPSTTTSLSLSELESVTANKLSSPQSEVDTEVPPTYQSQNTTRLPGKKCRLIVKFGANFDRSSAEDIASNTTTVSETMASKVCPVCKTFSSSSNTTLNAHIDQCLSGESTPKWTSDFKLSRHRIKPRKTRLMVDVYSTAKMCTLEELDRRNGTNWATIASLPSQDPETLVAEARKQRVHPEETGDVGAVYIDSSGTKVRILSKLDDAPVVSKGEAVDPRKPFKGGKSHKLFSTKKKMKHVHKDHRYLKLTPQSKKLRSYNKEHKSQINEGQERLVAKEVGRDKSMKNQNFMYVEHAKPNDRGSLGQWVCSKRTGLTRKGKSKDGHQPLRCELHVARDLMTVETDQPNSRDSLVERRHVQRLANLSENACSFAEVSDRMDSSSHEAWDSEGQWSPGRKRMRSSLAVPRNMINRDAERALSSMKQKTDHSSKGAMSLCEKFKWNPPSRTANQASALESSNKAVETCAGSPIDSDNTEPSRSCYGFPSKAMGLSSLRKKVSSLSPSPGTGSKYNAIKKSSVSKKPQMHVMAETSKEAVAWRQQELMQTCTVNRSGREYVSDSDSDSDSDEDSLGRSVSTSQREEAMADVDEVKSMDLSEGDSDDVSDEYDSIEFTKTAGIAVDYDSTSKVAVGDNLACSSKSLNPEFPKVGNSMKFQSNSLQPIEDHSTQLCTNEPDFVDGPVMFSGDVVGNVQSSHSGTELNCEIEQGNSFLDVDPIPIPGPPGSFLPSPGGDDSSEEDFHGNSSLTTSRFQSSVDQHELVNNKGSSDSPVSATSSISNPTAARFDVNYTEPLSAGSCSVKDKFGSGFFDADIEPSLKNAPRVEAERFAIDGESLKVSKMPIEKGRLNFRNDDQPCCCSRKERVTQGAGLNYEEPQLLGHRTIAPVTVPAVGKQMNPEMFSLSSCRSSGSEKEFSAVSASSLGPLPSPKFSAPGDCSPSGVSNPILRLMGKNLMVVNKDEDTCTAAPQAQVPLHAQNNHPSLQFPPFPGNIRSQDYNSFQPFMNQGLVSFSHGQPFDVRMSNGSRFQSAHAFQNQYIGGGSFAVYGDELRGEQYQTKNSRVNGAPMYYDLEKNAGAGIREIIMIDDGNENEGVKQSLSVSHHQTRFEAGRVSNTSPVKWSCTSEGPPGMQQRTLYNGAVPPRTNHLRSPLYYSPNLS